MTLLLLIRHGENDFMLRRLTGRTAGISLNAKGRQQAQMLADALTHAPLQAIYASPLERAVETAQPLAAAHGLEIQVRPALIEVDYGRLQGRTYKQLARINLWKILLEQPSQIRFPEGETFAEVQQRVVTELDSLVRVWQPAEDINNPAKEKKPEEAVIAVVVHADIVRLALAHFLNMQLDDFLRLVVGPASISMVQSNGRSLPRVICINQTANFSWHEPKPLKKRSKAIPD
ncbi:MAG TPA: histidine phosphatase family protein [Bellilinea sp.]|nr:histidine phosphatase family protein [Bellilinea sp.]